MKERHTFFCPDASTADILPEEEARHAIRALRLAPGDDIFLLDGKGMIYEAVVETTTNKHCQYRVITSTRQQKWWKGYHHVAMAPTKNMERTEVMVEKAVEMGVDEITFLRGRFSERTTLRLDRIRKIVIAAMKQSRNAYMPVLNDMTGVQQFLRKQSETKNIGQLDSALCIAHCYTERARVDFQQFLMAHPRLTRLTMMIGPEGDFSIDEVSAAQKAGAQEISLGENRFRTETAAMVALMTMHFAERQHKATTINNHDFTL